MKYKKVNKFVTDDNSVFDTKIEAQNHCDQDALYQEFEDTWLNGFMDFEEILQEYSLSDFDDAIGILTKMLEFKSGELEL